MIYSLRRPWHESIHPTRTPAIRGRGMKAAATHRKPKEKDKKGIEAQCLFLWSHCVRTRDRACRICNSDRVLQGHHVRSRTHKATYLDLENGIVLCSKHHCLQKFNPERFQDMVIDAIGNEEYQRLKVKSQREFKPTMPWLLEMKDYLKRTLKSLEADFGKLNP
jgi:hypothetical protein